MSKKKLLAALSVAALLSGLTACSSTRSDSSSSSGAGASGAAGGLIGIAMPTRSLERWNNDGAHLDDLLKKAGYTTSVQFADNKVEQQITQIENMINQNPKVIVVASIDGTALGPVLRQAADAEDQDHRVRPPDQRHAERRLLRDVRQLQGRQAPGSVHRQDRSGSTQGKGPFNLEPFAGSPDDNNAKFFFAGAWDVLNPYVKSGKLVVPSRQGPGDQRRLEEHRYPGLELADRPVRDGQPAELVLHAARRSTSSSPPTTRSPWASSSRWSRRATSRAPSGRSSPARTPTSPTPRTSSPASRR